MSSDQESSLELASKPKRRKRGTVNAREEKKRLRLASHVPGEDCKCVRWECYKNVTEQERCELLAYMNILRSKDEQDAFLCSMITCGHVRRRRPRAGAKEKDHSYKYKLHVLRDERPLDIRVCYKAMLSIFGITNRRLQYLKKSLTTYARSPQDQRGRHKKNPGLVPQSDIQTVHEHIKSLMAHKSHNSTKKAKVFYLSEDLNVRKLYLMYKERYPESKAYENMYRKIFNTSYKISFGVPRDDASCTKNESSNNSKGLSKEDLAQITEETAQKPHEKKAENGKKNCTDESPDLLSSYLVNKAISILAIQHCNQGTSRNFPSGLDLTRNWLCHPNMQVASSAGHPTTDHLTIPT